MGRSSRNTFAKRQRELRTAEKAAAKRARRHGKSLEPTPEPRPTGSVEPSVAPSERREGEGTDVE